MSVFIKREPHTCVLPRHPLDRWKLTRHKYLTATAGMDFLRSHATHGIYISQTGRSFLLLLLGFG